MALIECCECGARISDRASACPHCGCPIEYVMDVSCGKVFCGECGSGFDIKLKKCPECGCSVDISDLLSNNAGTTRYPLDYNLEVLENGGRQEEHLRTVIKKYAMLGQYKSADGEENEFCNDTLKINGISLEDSCAQNCKNEENTYVADKKKHGEVSYIVSIILSLVMLIIFGVIFFVGIFNSIVSSTN